MSHKADALAKRYAKALLQIEPPAELESVRDSLAALADLWSQSLELRNAMLNPSTPQKERLAVVADLAAASRPGDELFANFLKVLVENNRIAGIESIAQAFSAMVDEIRKLLALEITSARAISDEEKENIVEKIKSEFGTMASVTWEVDSNLLGGLVVKSGDRLLDSSVKGSLERARAELLA